MLVSIIIPTLNEARCIQTTLQLLQHARECQYEVVLVDGGSSDSTVDIATPMVDLVLASGTGRAAQMNAGANAAAGDVFWFLHADTRVNDAALTALVDAATHAGTDHYWGRFDARLDAEGWPFRLIGLMMNLRSRVTSVATGDQGLFVSRALFQELGGFACLPLMEDVEFSKRLRSISKPLNLRIQLLTSARRWQNGGVVRTILLMWTLRLGYVCRVSPAMLASWYRQTNQ